MTAARRSRTFFEHTPSTSAASSSANLRAPSIACAIAALLSACTGARSALSLGVDAGERDAGMAIERPPFCVADW